ncbi:hypothetical protein NLJ89_g7274 [Agrocybe chaxingu]|uniref:Uncharacterized protein n=1 Tax=Agrocybe chaxingu TaxID=84603 RepID=A0A9W8JUV3_9AGAR|nr:hypothetical protein NLJ89_g7274 [Agrocybe chaxingu]
MSAGHFMKTEERPTLPPLHTLNLLPRPSRANVKYEHHDNLRTVASQMPRTCHIRQVSSSSSHTNASRNASPSPSECDSDISPLETPSKQTKFRLVPCEFAAADAVILVPPPGTSYAGAGYNYVPREGNPQGLLLVGQALQHVRHPERHIAKGARIHPYRIARSANSSTGASRRSSVISITAFNPTQ